MNIVDWLVCEYTRQHINILSSCFYNLRMESIENKEYSQSSDNVVDIDWYEDDQQFHQLK